MELPNSRTFIELKLDEMSLILGMDSPLPCLPLEVKVIFDLNIILVTTCFERENIAKLHLAPSFSGLD